MHKKSKSMQRPSTGHSNMAGNRVTPAMAHFAPQSPYLGNMNTGKVYVNTTQAKQALKKKRE
jgi:hypothetical protein